MATALHMKSMAVNEEQTFKLDYVCGSVHTTQMVTVGPFENTTVSGILKSPVKNCAYHKHVNVTIGPLEAHKEGEHNFCAVPGYTFLKSGSDRVKVMIKNLTARTIKVEQGSKIASMEAANAESHMLVPQGSTHLPTENKIMKGTNINIPQQELSMINIEGTE